MSQFAKEQFAACMQHIKGLRLITADTSDSDDERYTDEEGYYGEEDAGWHDGDVGWHSDSGSY